MTRRAITIILAALPLIATAGCVRTIASVATAPVKATGKVVDWSTTSPSERDRAYARKMRKQAERCHKHPDAPECAQNGYAQQPQR
ncbi:adenylyl-sulfate kinase [Sphingomonas sp. MMSM20]|uniref:adenylyl-sulfate kinase n=1 Tax=Sphingomonas lycopersici TaxID=2951807 RepID=UPI002238DF59|nr:adenylyl-sulfate kinase [Sphingomonas lycopersici]MCW6532094.1 adenylyl-sulfate kinase [Sphingomonas lycopersici]